MLFKVNRSTTFFTVVPSRVEHNLWSAHVYPIRRFSEFALKQLDLLRALQFGSGC